MIIGMIIGSMIFIIGFGLGVTAASIREEHDDDR